MRRAADFLDTNVLVYAFSNDPRAARSEEVLATGCASSVQVLNEFANVARRKLAMSWSEIGDALASVREVLDPIAAMDVQTHEKGIKLCERYGFSIFDGLIVASALSLGCRRLWSADMQHDLLVEGIVRIGNPYRA